MFKNKFDHINTMLRERSFLKVITGIFNFNKEKVLQVAAMADKATNVALDICAREDIVAEVKERFPNLILVVSSIKVSELKRAQELGADILELGNFEALYEQGIFYSEEEVLKMTRELLKLRKEGVMLSVTVPGHLKLDLQVKLAKTLEDLGIDIIQTEGAALSDANISSALGSIQKVALTLANTIELSKHIKNTAIMTASGLSPDTAALAITAGAKAIGVGAYVNKLDTDEEILAAINKLKISLSLTQIEKTLEEQELIYS